MRTATRVPRPRLPLFATLAVMFILVEDVLARLNIQGAVTVIVVVLGLLILPDHLRRWNRRESRLLEPTNPRRDRPSMWMIAFVVWSGVLLLANPSVQGAQNWLVWLLFPLTMTLVAAQTTQGTAARLHRWWRRAAVVSALGYLGIATAFGPGYADSFYAARPAGWTAVGTMALLVPWAALMGAPKWPALLQVLASGASLTRTSTALAGLMVIGLAASIRKGGGRARVAVMGLFVGAGGILAMTQIPALRNRFLQGDEAVNVGGVALNTSGRDALWKMTYRASFDHIWIGHGPGQSQYLIRRVFITIEHPHNEYLRFLYDTGLIGLLLWVIGIVTLGRRAWRRYRTADLASDRAVHLAAVLALVTFGLGNITDNLTVSIAFTLIVGALVGMSLGRANASQEELRTNDAVPVNVLTPRGSGPRPTRPLTFGTAGSGQTGAGASPCL